MTLLSEFANLKDPRYVSQNAIEELRIGPRKVHILEYEVYSILL